MSFQVASAAPHNSTLPRESASGDRDGPPLFSRLVRTSRGQDWNLFHWRHVTSHAYFWFPFWVCGQNHFIKPSLREPMGNLSFPLVTRKWPRQQWRELVKLLQPVRPECFTQRSQGPRQLPGRPEANEAPVFIGHPRLLGWDPSCWASNPVKVVELCVQPGKRGRGR